jgi:hypothetical protein
MSEPAIQPRSWWSRNWKWIVPAGCLVVILGIAALLGFIGLIFGAVVTGIRSTDVYEEALDRVRASPEAAAALGEPIEEKWWISGNIQVNGPSGNADFAVPLTGPKADGKLYVVAYKQAGRWSMEVLELEVEGREARIDLLSSP